MTTWLGSVALLAFVMAGTPGPNNLLFAAAGARGGYVRTLPMLAGMIAGFIAIIGATAAGLNDVFDRVPQARQVLTSVASAYMVWLAFHLWRASPPDDSPSDDSPSVPGRRWLSWWQMGLFQIANPKTWLAVLTLVTGRLGPQSPGGLEADLLGAGVFLLVVWCAASLWTLFGAALRATLRGHAWHRSMRLMAVLAVVTIPTFWT